MICWLFLAVVAEIVIGNYGVVAPVVGIAVFYFATVAGWPRALVPSLAAGALVDLALGRRLPVAVTVAALLVLMARFWVRHGTLRRFRAQSLPGGAVGAVAGTVQVVLASLIEESGGLGLLWHNARLVAGSTLAGVAGLPLACWLLDRMAGRMAIPLYRRGRPGDEHHGR